MVDAERQISTFTRTDTADSVTSSLTVTSITTPEFFVTRFLSGTYMNLGTG
ncbi:hypothetical protein DPMN_094035 [Dreissena polymorpha]|uniref:Uncharacterized protein n=1 Tax=Dreissena polymorpha TaxID=45954 RepID=A0A9D4L5C4_DREPO|nr:hypothetical protein DPMN_094035 [Dreissena polymorpha]